MDANSSMTTIIFRNLSGRRSAMRRSGGRIICTAARPAGRKYACRAERAGLPSAVRNVRRNLSKKADRAGRDGLCSVILPLAAGMFVLPVIHAFMVSKRQIHIRRVLRHFVHQRLVPNLSKKADRAGRDGLCSVILQSINRSFPGRSMKDFTVNPVSPRHKALKLFSHKLCPISEK